MLMKAGERYALIVQDFILHGALSVSPSAGSKVVSFMNGADGNPWTWVMGEHPDDKSIEQILEDEAMEKAQILAEQEAEKLRYIELGIYRQVAWVAYNLQDLHTGNMLKACSHGNFGFRM